MERVSWLAALAELDPPPRDVFAEIGYVPTDKQRVFHDATEYDVLFGGSLGGGKSRSLMAEAIRACALHPGIRVGAFRRTYGELKESLVPELAAMGFGSAVGGRWNGTEYELRFTNGSLLMLRYAENLADASRRQGGQYQLLLFDERTLVNPEVCAFLESRVRSGRSDLPVLGVRSTANPGGPGHGAVRQRYIDPTDYGQRVVTDPDTGQSVRFIPSSMRDNPHLDAGYERRLASLPEAMRRAMRDGDWGVFAGQVFTEFSRARHIVPRFDLPASWKRGCGIDYGWSAPWVVIWGAQDGDGRVWLYREITGRKVIERDQARAILAAEAPDERIAFRAADPAMWAQTGEAKSVADQYASENVRLTKADNSRLTGKQRMHSFLADGPACAHHRALGWEDCPKLHVLDGTCPELVRTLPMLPYDPRRPEDVDTNAEDHHFDSARYLLMALGQGPPRVRWM